VRTTSLLLALVALGVGLASSARAQVQKDRLGRTEPGLMVETGARMAPCDALLFTADGRRLLAAGDDKVVRSWQFGPRGLDPRSVQGLRWPTWREQRGAIYALALSPDNQFVAVAGLGVRTAAVAVLDRASGKIVAALTDVRGLNNAIRAIAFSPDGNAVAYGPTDGSVWVWNWNSARANDARRLGIRPGRGGRGINIVRYLTFTDARHVLSVAEEGQVILWDLERPGGERDLLRLPDVSLRCVTLSPDRRWLAAGTKYGANVNHILLRSLDGQAARDVALDPLEFPRSLAFDARGKRLAVAVGRLVRQNTGFADEEDDRVRVYDVSGQEPRLDRTLPPVYHADALAFHPRDNVLGVAGGANDEVTVWDLARGRPIGEPVRSPGASLWGVGVSKDGNLLGFQEARAEVAADPNRRGSGPWRVFDLYRRKFTSAAFQPVEPRPTAGGWTVGFTPDQARWEVIGPDGRRFALPWDQDRDSLPRCYTFLEPTADKPVRLVVGHYWGASIFELGDAGPRRVRLLTGHQGEVTAVAPSGDQNWLVTCGRDQTIAAWSLDDLAFQPTLGASFQARQDRVFVQAVDAGGPAWEAGLVPGDEVVLFQFNVAEFVFDPEGRKKGLAGVRERGGAERCVEVLGRPQPGKQFYFWLRRQGESDLIETGTTVRQRPLWRFFPTRTGEWVLWMWQNYYYDTSTNGDSFVGWLVNPDFAKSYGTPTFHPAESMRSRFHRPAVIDQLLGTRNVKQALQVASNDPLPVKLSDVEAPSVSLTVKPETVGGTDPVAAIEVSAQGTAPEQRLSEVELWVNDLRFQTWSTARGTVPASVPIPRRLLRSGRNEIVLQGYNAAGARADDSKEVQYDPPDPPAKPRLYALLLGVADYSRAQHVGGQPIQDLPLTLKDVDAMRTAWQKQGGGRLYGAADVRLLPEAEISHTAVARALGEIAREAGPEDRLVVFLSGHGDLLPGSDAFVFCGPAYDRRRPRETGITATDLYEALARVPCHKLVLLDACHAGDAATRASPARGLTPGARGSIVLCACDRSEDALGNREYGSLFTYAVAEALDRAAGFPRADANHDQLVDVAELAGYVQARLPELLAAIKAQRGQTPAYFPASLPNLPLAAP
jgi:WD40 repeat protein